MANVIGNPFMVYTYWSKVYHLVFDDLYKVIEKKLGYAEALNSWLGKNDFAVTNEKVYSQKLKQFNAITDELNILNAAYSLFPSIKFAYDRYLMFMTEYNDTEKEFLRSELAVLKAKIRRYEQVKGN